MFLDFVYIFYVILFFHFLIVFYISNISGNNDNRNFNLVTNIKRFQELVTQIPGAALVEPGEPLIIKVGPLFSQTFSLLLWGYFFTSSYKKHFSSVPPWYGGTANFRCWLHKRLVQLWLRPEFF